MSKPWKRAIRALVLLPVIWLLIAVAQAALGWWVGRSLDDLEGHRPRIETPTTPRSAETRIESARVHENRLVVRASVPPRKGFLVIGARTGASEEMTITPPKAFSAQEHTVQTVLFPGGNLKELTLHAFVAPEEKYLLNKDLFARSAWDRDQVTMSEPYTVRPSNPSER